MFVDELIKYPDALAIDIGANIGEFALFAAKLGRNVIAVEPFLDNCISLHNTVARDKQLAERITLVQNAVSDVRHEVKEIKALPSNVGGQEILHSQSKTFTRADMKENKYLVETVEMNDLIDALVDNSWIPGFLKQKRRAVMKIDIEGFEPLAFKKARRFLSELDIVVILMEAEVMKRGQLPFSMVTDIFALLKEFNYKPFTGASPLDTAKWMEWPWDMEWRKQ